MAATARREHQVRLARPASRRRPERDHGRRHVNRNRASEPCPGPPSQCATYSLERTWRISADAGATWRDLAVSDEPVESAPPSGGVVRHLMTTDTHPDRLYAVDPAMGRLAPLANQPPLVEYETITVPLSAGVWLEGLDPTTRRPAVAVSRDGGATWVTSTFEAEKQIGDQLPVRPGISRPDVRTADGQTAFAMFAAEAGPVRVYRTTDGGQSWQRTQSRRAIVGRAPGSAERCTRGWPTRAGLPGDPDRSDQAGREHRRQDLQAVHTHRPASDRDSTDRSGQEPLPVSGLQHDLPVGGRA